MRLPLSAYRIRMVSTLQIYHSRVLGGVWSFGRPRKRSAGMLPRFLASTSPRPGSIPVRARAGVSSAQRWFIRDSLNRSSSVLPHHLSPPGSHPSRRYSTIPTTVSAASTAVQSSNPSSMYPPIEPYDSGMLKVTSVHTL